jgi:hypothetical protein
VYSIRLIDEVEGQSRTIELSKIPLELQGPGGESNSASAEQHEKNMCRERKIFGTTAVGIT